jgi:hypothetical protein
MNVALLRIKYNTKRSRLQGLFAIFCRKAHNNFVIYLFFTDFGLERRRKSQHKMGV